MRVLIVDADRNFVEGLQRVLKETYCVDVSLSGKEGCVLATTSTYDLIVLDINLVDMDGLEVCSFIRHSNPNLPILVLTNETDESYKVHSLDSGADDYLIKPFSTAELLARIRALLRRSSTVTLKGRVTIRSITLDSDARSVKIKNKLIQLKRKEFEILELFMRNPGRVFSKEAIIKRLWEYDNDITSNAIEVHISHLRRHLKSAGCGNFIKTLHGFGYKLENAE